MKAEYSFSLANSRKGIHLILIFTLIAFIGIPTTSAQKCTGVKQCLYQTNTNSTAQNPCGTLGPQKNATEILLRDTNGYCISGNCGSNSKCYDSATYYCYDLVNLVMQLDGTCGQVCNMNSCNGGNNKCLANSATQLRDSLTGNCVLNCPSTSNPAQCLTDQINYNCRAVSSSFLRNNDNFGTCSTFCDGTNCYLSGQYICGPVSSTRYKQISTSACDTACRGYSCNPNDNSYICQATAPSKYKSADGICIAACPVTQCISDPGNYLCALTGNSPLTVRRLEDNYCANSCSSTTCYKRENNYNCQLTNAGNVREISSICNIGCSENYSCLHSYNDQNGVNYFICEATSVTKLKDPSGVCIFGSGTVGSSCPPLSCLQSTTSYYCLTTMAGRVRETNHFCNSTCSGATCFITPSYTCRGVINMWKRQLSGICGDYCTENYSCEPNNSSYVCIRTDANNKRLVAGPNNYCALVCADGSCYDSSSYYCEGTGSPASGYRVKDTNGSCQNSCTGATCWSSANSYTCLATNTNNNKEIANYNMCVAQCSGNTCSDGSFVCRNTNNSNYKQIDARGSCNTTCIGTSCISNTVNFLCSPTDVNHLKDIDNVCRTSCSGNNCYTTSNYICGQTNGSNFKNTNSLCIFPCPSDFCAIDNIGFICKATSTDNVLALDHFCYSACPTSECDNGTHTCIPTDSSNHRNHDPNHEFSGDGVCKGICDGFNCWTAANTYNCGPTDKDNFKDIVNDGVCNTKCSDNSCLRDTYSFVCDFTLMDPAHNSGNDLVPIRVKDLDGSCQLQCTVAACFQVTANSTDQDYLVCVETQLSPLIVKDTIGRCGITCLGNNCWTSANDFTCRQTDAYNYKQLDDSCNSICMGNSCISDITNFLCSQTGVGNVQDLDNTCKSTCSTGGCINNLTDFICLNTNHTRVRDHTTDGNNHLCQSSCSTGAFCWSSDYNYECKSTNNTHYRQLDSSCSSVCQNNSCYPTTSSDFVCTQTSSPNNYRKDDGSCEVGCAANECLNDPLKYLCLTASASRLISSGNCNGSVCPDASYCYVSGTFNCVLISSFTPAKVGRSNFECTTACPTGQCLNTSTNNCDSLGSGVLLGIYGQCVPSCQTGYCSDPSFVCIGMNANSFLTTSGFCAGSCPSEECYGGNFTCISVDSSHIRDSSTNSFNCIQSGVNCNAVDDCISNNSCISITNVRSNDGNCASACSSGYCKNGSNHCIATSAVNYIQSPNCSTDCDTGFCKSPNSFECLETNQFRVKAPAANAFFCMHNCPVGYCYDTNNYECQAISSLLARHIDGSCSATSCPSGYCINANNVCQPGIPLLGNNCSATCDATHCADTNLVCQPSSSILIRDAGFCSSQCSSRSQCYDGTYNCVNIPNGQVRAPDTSCQASCPPDSCKIQTTPTTICITNTSNHLKHPTSGICLQACPANYCYDVTFNCVSMDNTHYLNLNGSCQTTCLGNSCKSTDLLNYTCVATSQKGWVKLDDGSTNCALTCPPLKCINDFGVCTNGTFFNIIDVNGFCRSGSNRNCTGNTCSSSNSPFTCTPATNITRKVNNTGMCTSAASCPGNTCYDPLNFTCYTTTSSIVVDGISNCRCSTTNAPNTCYKDNNCHLAAPGFIVDGGAICGQNRCQGDNFSTGCYNFFSNICNNSANQNGGVCDNNYYSRISYLDYVPINETTGYHELEFLYTTSQISGFPNKYYFSIFNDIVNESSQVKFFDMKYYKYYELYKNNLSFNILNTFVVYYDFTDDIDPNNSFHVFTTKAYIARNANDATTFYNNIDASITTKVVVSKTISGFVYNNLSSGDFEGQSLHLNLIGNNIRPST